MARATRGPIPGASRRFYRVRESVGGEEKPTGSSKSINGDDGFMRGEELVEGEERTRCGRFRAPLLEEDERAGREVAGRGRRGGDALRPRLEKGEARAVPPVGEGAGVRVEAGCGWAG
jgi:hypothetical protein